jgi:hypothetical protein
MKCMEEQELQPTEIISRFLFKDDFYADLGVKPKAFRPSRKDQAVSIYRNGALNITGCETALNESEVWALADKMIGERPHRGSVNARTDFEVSHVTNSSLDLNVVEHRADHDRHGHIQPYPVISDDMSDAEQRKAENRRLTISTKLAQNLKADKR